jgi:hypothetical protein
MRLCGAVYQRCRRSLCHGCLREIKVSHSGSYRTKSTRQSSLAICHCATKFGSWCKYGSLLKADRFDRAFTTLQYMALTSFNYITDFLATLSVAYKGALCGYTTCTRVGARPAVPISRHHNPELLTPPQ